MAIHPLLLVVLAISAASCSSSDSAGTSPGASGASGQGGSSSEGGSAGSAQGGGTGVGGAQDAGADAPAGHAGACSDCDGSFEAGSVGPYGPCTTDTECQAPYTCSKPFSDLAYGQCTRTCSTDADCPASPSANQVGCHPDAKTCLSLCGAYGGACPVGLVCTAQQFCLPPSTTTATKGPGEHCTGSAECLDDAECVEGEYTKAYCAPLCQTNEDCSKAAPGSSGQCTDATTFKFCMFFCGMMANGATCPGDMVCEGNAVCR